jgi:gliding motility-associated lipoprotein GldH
MTSCDSSRVYENNAELPGAIWEQGNVLKFDAEIPDSSKRYNFYINIRNDETYPYSNLYVFLTTHFPDKRISKDTLELLLADENGNWYGKGSGDRKFNQILLQKKIKFPISGKYTFQIEQGMRLAELPGITDAGIRIEYFDE